MKSPTWHDPDRTTYGPRPEDYYSPFGWDAADQTLFRPMARFFAVDPAGVATNVNAFDEVPSSSWFHNRIGRFPMTAQQVAQGACTIPDLDPKTTWTVKGAKPNGANPGFVIRSAAGVKYLLKFDGTLQGERATTADVLGSRLYHAVGYHSPCNTVVFFDPSILEIDPEASSVNAVGDDVPLTQADIDEVLSKSYRLPDGRYRASASEYLPGRPLGPWRYEGTRDDDPNDVVNHMDRRELRGGYVLASWLNHFDAREQNTIDVWMDAGDDQGYIRHYYLDFGDCLGSLWEQEGISRRLGHANYLDIPYLVKDTLTLGLVARPWQDPQFGPTGAVLGYFEIDNFVPDEWKTGYPNPAFIRATEWDNAWMARIIAEIDEPRLRAALSTARVQDRLTHDEIIRTLMGRRAKLLERWFSQLSPLSHPRIARGEDGRAELCVRDLAVYSGVADRASRKYAVSIRVGDQQMDVESSFARKVGLDGVCTRLPVVGGATPERPGFLIVQIDIGRTELGALRVHVYQRGEGDYLVAGLERPAP